VLCHLTPGSAPVLSNNTAIYRELCSLIDEIDLPQQSGLNWSEHDGKTWSWQTLYADTVCRYGLLHLPANGYIPLHDHAEAYGLSMVLEGHPFLLTPMFMPGKGRLINEKQIRVRRLHKDQISVILPGNHNIHGFRTDHESSTVLSFTIQKTNQVRHWYFTKPFGINDSIAYPRRLLLLTFIVMIMAGLSVTHAGECDKQVLGQFLREQSKHRDINHLLACAREDYPQAQFWVADAYQSARGVNQDLAEAAYWYGRAAQQGMPEAQLRYGEMIMNGEGITEDSAEALDWIFKSYMGGNKEAEAMFHYLMTNPAPLDC
jgi:hypothetical protein